MKKKPNLESRSSSSSAPLPAAPKLPLPNHPMLLRSSLSSSASNLHSATRSRRRLLQPAFRSLQSSSPSPARSHISFCSLPCCSGRPSLLRRRFHFQPAFRNSQPSSPSPARISQLAMVVAFSSLPCCSSHPSLLWHRFHFHLPIRTLQFAATAAFSSQLSHCLLQCPQRLRSSLTSLVSLPSLCFAAATIHCCFGAKIITIAIVDTDHHHRCPVPLETEPDRCPVLTPHIGYLILSSSHRCPVTYDVFPCLPFLNFVSPCQRG